ncbi:MAG: bacterial Ig-like domain-containing protein [Bacilli bacterium]|nr:bacterial Ig-like domain-containing protein [Bacilli bacterium]
MNKLFTKIVGVVLGATMAVGVGVAVASNSKVSEVNAAAGDKVTKTLTFTSNFYGISTTQGNQTLTGDGATYGFEFVKGSGTGAKASGSSPSSTSYVLFGKSGVYFRNTSAPANSYISAISWTYSSGVSTNVVLGIGYGASALDASASVTNQPKATQSGTVSLTPTDTSKSYFIIKVTNAYNCQWKSFSVTWTEKASSKTLSSISLGGSYPKSFYTGDTFSHTGMTVTANYSDSTSADVTSSATWSSPDMSTTGEKTVTVSYTEGTTKTADYVITVTAAPTAVSAEVINDMSKKAYYVGDPYDVDGLTLRVTYDNSDTRDFDFKTELTKDTDYILDHDNAVLGDVELYLSGEYLGCEFDFTVEGITVSAAPQKYTITGPSTTQASGTGLTVETLNEYYPIDSSAYIEWTAVSGSAYGSSTSAMRFGTSTASASGYVTLSLKENAPIYFTKVVVNAKTWSSETGNTLKVNNSTKVVTTSYEDYEFSIESDATSINFGNGTKRVNIYAIDVYYGEKTPVLHVSSASVEAAINTNSTHVTFTYDNYTPTSYDAVVKSGSSLSKSAIAFDTSVTPHKATITTGNTTGTTVFTITGTGGDKSASVDVAVNVTNPRNIINLEITTAGTLTFKVGQAFDVGNLVVTATFDADPTTVVYSKANENLGELTFSPEIGYEFVEADIGSQTINISKAVGTGDESTSYIVTVSDKDYAAAVTSIDNLWDGQKVYFSNGTDSAFPMYTSGNNVSSVSATIHSSKGIDIVSTTAYQYTVGREKVDDTVYYTFALVDNNTIYYLKDAGTTSTNAIAKTTDKTDNTIYWTISAGAKDGQWHIVNKSNTDKPTLQVNGTYLSCYNNNQTDPYLYAVTSYSKEAVAESFKQNALHFADYDPSQSTKGKDTGAGWCKDSEHNYYQHAKNVWNAMTNDERGAVDQDALDRLSAWASANGDVLNGTNVLSTRTSISSLLREGSAVSIVIIVSSAVTLTAIGGYFFIRRRKKQY